MSYLTFDAGNEKEVGQGIKASGIPREEFFLTTKLNNIDHSNPAEALEQSLNNLDTPYLDLCMSLIHDIPLVYDTDLHRAHALGTSLRYISFMIASFVSISRHL